MATFGEIVYMVLDMLKEHSDDAYYTEEHILFLAKNLRAVLLERKYKQTRNGTYTEMSEENKQQICLSVGPATLLPLGCDKGVWLQSYQKIPALLPGFNAVACTGHDLIGTNVTFIHEERMPYVGYNKWLRNIVYASKSRSGYLYINGLNPQTRFLERVGLTGVFSDPEEAAKLSHEACMNGGLCDIMEQPFPIEADLVPSLIELIVQELTPSRYAPEDKNNDAKDNLGDAMVTQQTPSNPAEKQQESE